MRPCATRTARSPAWTPSGRGWPSASQRRPSDWRRREAEMTRAESAVRESAEELGLPTRSTSSSKACAPGCSRFGSPSPALWPACARARSCPRGSRWRPAGMSRPRRESSLEHDERRRAAEREATERKERHDTLAQTVGAAVAELQRRLADVASDVARERARAGARRTSGARGPARGGQGGRPPPAARGAARAGDRAAPGRRGRAAALCEHRPDRGCARRGRAPRGRRGVGRHGRVARGAPDRAGAGRRRPRTSPPGSALPAAGDRRAEHARRRAAPPRQQRVGDDAGGRDRRRGRLPRAHDHGARAGERPRRGGRRPRTRCSTSASARSSRTTSWTRSRARCRN